MVARTLSFTEVSVVSVVSSNVPPTLSLTIRGVVSMFVDNN
jgi:hypothetical protein